MPGVYSKQLEQYLELVFHAPIHVLDTTILGVSDHADPKVYSYGVPLKVDFELAGERRAAVLHTIAPGRFGHEHMPDRAQELLWEHHAYNRLSRHIRSYDICGFQPEGEILSLRSVDEFGLLTEYIEGQSYACDLERVRKTGYPSPNDLARADALCDYLAEIHATRGNDPELYVRRIRELVGHGQCVMGIVDSYPAHPVAPSGLLHKIEQLCVEWRWRLKDRTHRLRQVHGDFHPWNILFRRGCDFSVLDRSRGEYGDAADDVTSLSLNYVFFSLQRSGKLEGAFESLFERFWDRYVRTTRDSEILEVAAPFFAFRALVMASPVWYPSIADEVRRKLLRFAVTVLESKSFNPRGVNQYVGI
jgi:hypothetical protein